MPRGIRKKSGGFCSGKNISLEDHEKSRRKISREYFGPFHFLFLSLTPSKWQNRANIVMGYTCNDDDHENDDDDNPLDDVDDDDDDDHRLTSVIIGSNGRPWKIFTRALVAAFAGRAVGLTFRITFKINNLWNTC